MAVYLYDDPADIPKFFPFTQSRPIAELRHGAWLLRERAARALGPVAGHLASAHLADFGDPDSAPVVPAPGSQKPRIFLRSTFAVEEQELNLAGGGGPPGVRLTDAAGTSVGAVLAGSTEWAGPPGIATSWPAIALRGRLLAGAWELVAHLGETLRADLEAERAGRQEGRVPAGCTVLGDPDDLFVDQGTLVEPLVVFDTRGGPIWIQAGAEIRTFSRLAGPLVVGRGSRVIGGQLRDSSIGPRCVVHGEVSNSIFLGYANKAHDGFLGHSIVGRWANLGAGTITSNLKNTYGTIRLNLGGERVETGMQFLGSLIGDHVKTAIGTMLPTGCVIGTGANLFGTTRPASSVPAFAWGTEEPGRLLACRMFLQTAAKVLPRRDVAFDDAARRYLESIWRHATGQPCA
jgi:UDP-N-acetylglucosamine diphosphorylase/glucosamine-1-phosphate N-acetyltransferase